MWVPFEGGKRKWDVGKKLESEKDHVDKPESGVTVALVRGVSTCHSPIIQY